MKNIAIIPARGGSKRIPRKNIKPFMGKPIIAYSIEAALESGLFDEVMVSTEIYTLSLHDALPICNGCPAVRRKGSVYAFGGNCE